MCVFVRVRPYAERPTVGGPPALSGSGLVASPPSWRAGTLTAPVASPVATSAGRALGADPAPRTLGLGCVVGVAPGAASRALVDPLRAPHLEPLSDAADSVVGVRVVVGIDGAAEEVDREALVEPGELAGGVTLCIVVAKILIEVGDGHGVWSPLVSGATLLHL